MSPRTISFHHAGTSRWLIQTGALHLAEAGSRRARQMLAYSNLALESTLKRIVLSTIEHAIDKYVAYNLVDLIPALI